MSKVYKGYELIKAIADGEIKEGSRFIDKTDTKYYEGTTIHTFKYQNKNFIQEKIGGVNIVSILNHDFELIEDETIDIDNIEEFEIDKNNYIQTELGAFKTRKMDIAFLNKINELVQAVKQLNKEIKSIKEK